MTKLVVMLVLATLGVGIADQHEPEWKEFAGGVKIPFDSETEILQLKTQWEGENDQSLEIRFFNGDKSSAWYIRFGDGEGMGFWRIDPCMDMYLTSTKFTGAAATEMTGEVTWSFTKKEGIMTVLLNGEEWKKIQPIDAEGTPTPCSNDEDMQNWVMKSTEVQFSSMKRLDKSPTHYRVVAQEKEDGDNEDKEDKEDYSGSSQVCVNGLVLISTLFAGLRL